METFGSIVGSMLVRRVSLVPDRYPQAFGDLAGPRRASRDILGSLWIVMEPCGFHSTGTQEGHADTSGVLSQ